MDCKFPVIISKLRKSKGLSQKQAAKDLQISQALLSHYERGIRECGLDFVIKAAKYYNVSADYILGLSSEQNVYKEESAAQNEKQISGMRDQLEKLKRSFEKTEKYFNENF